MLHKEFKSDTFGWITQEDVEKYPFLKNDYIPTEFYEWEEAVKSDEKAYMLDEFGNRIKNDSVKKKKVSNFVVSYDFWEFKREKKQLDKETLAWWLSVRQERFLYKTRRENIKKNNQRLRQSAEQSYETSSSQSLIGL